jgi:asparagine synthase (glutamine-hydrolysing)
MFFARPREWTRGDARARTQDTRSSALGPIASRLRRSKGDASRFNIQQLKANRDLLADTLMNGALVANGLIDRSDVEAALRPSSYGVDTFGRMILVCYVIEAWLSRWTRRQTAP